MKKAKISQAVQSAVNSQPPVAHGIGRRKASVARVWLRKGSGKIQVNGKDYADYFDVEIARLDVSLPVRTVPAALEYDVEANVMGGGFIAQAGAIKLGIARALLETDEQLRVLLREHNLLTVDSRLKERKKYGQKAARRKFQFVKR